MIFEDPDELGYFTDQEVAKRPLVTSSLVICNAIMPMQERADLEAAAINAHEGHDLDAERCRKYAGYNNIGRRPDADYVR